MMHHPGRSTNLRSCRSFHPVEAPASGLDVLAREERAPVRRMPSVALKLTAVPAGRIGLAGIEDIAEGFRRRIIWIQGRHVCEGGSAEPHPEDGRMGRFPDWCLDQAASCESRDGSAPGSRVLRAAVID